MMEVRQTYFLPEFASFTSLSLSLEAVMSESLDNSSTFSNCSKRSSRKLQNDKTSANITRGN